ncbi:GNAT family N-acetyltransferase [Flavobacterium sp. H122]|uniref:GNAT family N-acetyltransferase n=1 Tax=Flavobacterium sp. H122 TaxID=2529860 RepID=UPI0010AA8636|nr:GNAT family N-acetyltransferase [Flavobacterium sp. H122]
MIRIEIISSDQTLPIRHAVLRKGMPLESCIFDGDDLPSTVHFGIFENDGLKGVVSVFEHKNSVFNETKQYQVRGMAILDSEQKKGYGRLLMEYLEQFLKENKTDLIWFNAREGAVNFYKKLNYSVTGIPFEIQNIGIHLVMFKKL